MKRSLLLISTILICLMSQANDIKRISITHEYISDNPKETPEQAELMALQQAREKAMEQHFGLDVMGITSAMQRNRSEGSDVSSSSDVFSMSESSVRGEWIETIKQEILEKTFQNGFWHVRVYVEGRARKVTAEKVDIRYALTNNVDELENRSLYYDGNNIYLRFSSPVRGALCVYLVDEEQQVNRLLPHNQHNELGYHPIEADSQYVFFRHEDGRAYKLNCQKSSEQNMVYIIFSPDIFFKATDQEVGENWNGDELPPQLGYNDFRKWLSRNQTKDKNMVVKTEVITICK